MVVPNYSILYLMPTIYHSFSIAKDSNFNLVDPSRLLPKLDINTINLYNQSNLEPMILIIFL